MPIYEYQCRACGERTEALQRVSDPPLSSCSECGGELKKLISAPAFQFKGSGWYVTDYAGKGSGNGSSSSEKKSEPGDKSETKAKSDSTEKSGGDKSSSKKSTATS